MRSWQSCLMIPQCWSHHSVAYSSGIFLSPGLLAPVKLSWKHVYNICDPWCRWAHHWFLWQGPCLLMVCAFLSGCGDHPSVVWCPCRCYTACLPFLHQGEVCWTRTVLKQGVCESPSCHTSRCWDLSPGKWVCIKGVLMTTHPTPHPNPCPLSCESEVSGSRFVLRKV